MDDWHLDWSNYKFIFVFKNEFLCNRRKEGVRGRLGTDPVIFENILSLLPTPPFRPAFAYSYNKLSYIE